MYINFSTHWEVIQIFPFILIMFFLDFFGKIGGGDKDVDLKLLNVLLRFSSSGEI